MWPPSNNPWGTHGDPNGASQDNRWFCGLLPVRDDHSVSPQMHALLDHLWTRCGGGQALLDAIWRGETSTWPESFLQNSPSQLLQDFFNSLLDHQINIQKGSTALSHFEIEVDNAATALKTWLTDVCSNPALMLNFKPSVQGITTIDLTQEEAIIKFLPLRGNIALPQKANYDGYNIIPDNTSSVWEESWTHVVGAAPTVPMTGTSTSAQLPLPPEVERMLFSPSCIWQVKNLVSNENTGIVLASIGADKVASCVNATTTQAFDVKTKKDRK